MVFFDNVEAFRRVLPVGPHLSPTELPMFESSVLKLIDHQVFVGSNVADESGHVDLFREVFDVESNIHDLLLIVFGTLIRDQEGASHPRHRAFWRLNDALDVVVGEELPPFITLLSFHGCLQMAAANERVMDFGFFQIRIKFDFHCLLLEINLINVSKQAKQI